MGLSILSEAVSYIGMLGVYLNGISKVRIGRT